MRRDATRGQSCILLVRRTAVDAKVEGAGHYRRVDFQEILGRESDGGSGYTAVRM